MGIILCIPINAAEIIPPDVFLKVKILTNDLNAIRIELGSQTVKYILPKVSNVTPHEVYFQSMTLCEKAIQLRFEWTKKIGTCPPLKMIAIQPSDVYEQVIVAQVFIDDITKYFKIKKIDKKENRDLSKTPTDVFTSILKSNKILNLSLAELK